MQEQKELDNFEQFLEKKLQELKSCQESKNIGSCSLCEMIFECALRREYVRSVYESMSKGSSGDFDF